MIAFLWWRLLAFLLARYELIPHEGVAYLERWHFPRWLARKYGATYLFLHHFETSDPDRGWHNHPWWWCESELLRGAYVQSVPYFWHGEWRGALQVFNAGQRNRLTNEYHQVQLLRKPVWTLFKAGPKHGRSWGFMDSTGRKWNANGGMQ